MAVMVMVTAAAVPGKSVKAEKFMDFEAWLLKIGAFRIERIDVEH